MNYGTIYSILLGMILLPASWAAFGAVSGTAVCVILFVLAAVFLVRESRWTQSLSIAAVVLGLLALVCLALEAAHSARETARCIHCLNNLKQIAIGVQLYHDHHGCYPLPCTRDEAGQAMHSWRVLILPYITSQNVEALYDRTEPWDSPHNRKVLEQFRSVYSCPTARGWPPRSTTTNYVAVVDRRPDRRHPNTSQKNPDSQQQKADTFLIVEMANSSIEWSEPKDIYLDDLSALRSLVTNSPHRCTSDYFSRETPAINAVLIDGDMMFMFPWDSRTNVLTSLKCLLPPDPAKADRRGTKDGFYDDFYKVEPPPIHWLHCIGLPVWIVSLGLLLYQLTYSKKTRREATCAV